MTTIHCRDTGKTLNTENLPPYVQPCFCGVCGNRIGWYHDGFMDESSAYWCDDCAADLDHDGNTPEDQL